MKGLRKPLSLLRLALLRERRGCCRPGLGAEPAAGSTVRQRVDGPSSLAVGLCVGAGRLSSNVYV